MSATTKDFKNDATLLANKLAADDANGIKNENNNLILKSEMVLDGANHLQTSFGVGYMSLRSASYQSSFIIDTIELIPYSGAGGVLESPSRVLDNHLIYFKSPITSDGVIDFFIKIDGLPTKPFINENGDKLKGSQIVATIWTSAYFDKSKDAFILRFWDSNFLAKFSNTQTQFFQVGVDKLIEFDSILFETGGFSTKNNNIITLPVDGLYHVTTNLGFDTINYLGNGTSNIALVIIARLLKNSVPIDTQSFEISLTGNNFIAIQSITPQIYIDNYFNANTDDELSLEILVQKAQNQLTLFNNTAISMDLELVEAL